MDGKSPLRRLLCCCDRRSTRKTFGWGSRPSRIHRLDSYGLGKETPSNTLSSLVSRGIFRGYKCSLHDERVSVATCFYVPDDNYSASAESTTMASECVLQFQSFCPNLAHYPEDESVFFRINGVTAPSHVFRAGVA